MQFNPSAYAQSGPHEAAASTHLKAALEAVRDGGEQRVVAAALLQQHRVHGLVVRGRIARRHVLQEEPLQGLGLGLGSDAQRTTGHTACTSS